MHAARAAHEDVFADMDADHDTDGDHDGLVGRGATTASRASTTTSPPAPPPWRPAAYRALGRQRS
ncbi:hypothetical protein [Streptomyces sp. NPDC096033]|uniref:hypothetical protein n=1 Tax=Streptomyces sp. NPDC096033 TaxID=3366071 RepID=UPI0038018DF2